MKHKLLFFTLLLSTYCIPTLLSAQLYDDVIKWSAKIEDSGAAEKTLVLTATIENGWHMYDQNLPEGGPNSTEFLYTKLIGAQKIGEAVSDEVPENAFDKQFNMNLRWFSHKATFRQKLQVTNADSFALVVETRAQACNDETCLAPSGETFSFGATTASNSEEQQQPAGELSFQSLSDTDNTLGAIYEPVTDVLKAYGDVSMKQANSSLLMIFLFGFLGGFIALLTPCVWPMIPMTVSFFLKRTKKRKEAIRDAMVYGLAIIVIYLVLGLAITLIFGASALNSLSTNAFFNLIFFALLIFFAVSFFGAFEIVLPSRWTNRMDSKSDSTRGILSIFFMAFTLVLVSFSCTGPIIGTLLVQAASMGEILGPAIGMLGFAIALALPFSLFAIFPNWLQSMPKSGGWLNSVKVVMAFLELALSLKFLSVADLAYGWGILDRETFLALWIVIFFLLGVYLLGKIRFPHDTPLEKIGVGRFFLAVVSLSFAVYMVPGLWGAPLKAISAFSPPPYTQDFNLYNGFVHAKYDDYEEGMRYAAKVGKPVLIDFSGYGCVNCREMENNVWIDPGVKKILEEDYVLITLMVDDKTALPEPITVNDAGKTRVLRNIGDKWSYFQRTKFGASSQPFYVPIDNNGVPLGASYKRDLSIERYTNFLREGLAEYKMRTEQDKPIPGRDNDK